MLLVVAAVLCCRCCFGAVILRAMVSKTAGDGERLEKP
jgi:hypothetical protein